MVSAVLAGNETQDMSKCLGDTSTTNGSSSSGPDDSACRRKYVAYKPMVYIYSDSDGRRVNVNLGDPSKLTSTYPRMDASNGWNVIADRNGDLRDVDTGRNLYGLYWEGKGNHFDTSMHEGFIVRGKDSASFLEEKLAKLGLNEHEAEEFIVYWLPKMESHEYNYVRFETQDEINEYMPLDVNPKPDTVIRVMMNIHPLTGKEAGELGATLKPQKLPGTPSRNGLTVVEWGASEF